MEDNNNVTPQRGLARFRILRAVELTEKGGENNRGVGPRAMAFPEPKPLAPELPQKLLKTLDCSQGAVRAVRFNGECPRLPTRSNAPRGRPPGNPCLVSPSGRQLLPDMRQRQDTEAVEPVAGDAASHLQRPRLRSSGRSRVSWGLYEVLDAAGGVEAGIAGRG